MGRLPKAKKRIPFSATLKPESYKLLKLLAEHLDRSQGETIDRAVQALAVAESFGRSHLNLKSGGVFEPESEHLRLRGTMPVETAKLYEVKHTAQPIKPLLKPKDRKR